MVQPLFEQLSTQLNFLLLSQRQMILLSAFGVALSTFSNNITSKSSIKKIYLTYLSIVLFAYAIAVGIKAAVDFNDYITDVRGDTPALDNDEKKVVDRSKSWVYFSYILIAIVASVMFMFFKLRSFV